jgi:hypothetical protein
VQSGRIHGTTCKDGKHRVFLNISTYNSDAGESPKRKKYNIQNMAKVSNQEMCIGNV